MGKSKKELDFNKVTYIGESNYPFESIDVVYNHHPVPEIYTGKNKTLPNLIKHTLDISCSSSKRTLLHIDSLNAIPYVIEALMKFDSSDLKKCLGLFDIFSIENNTIEILMSVEKIITHKSTVNKQGLLIK